MAEVTAASHPIPVHVPFHRSIAYVRGLFGAFGSGKSYALCDEAIAWCLEQPGIRGLLTRKTVPELRDTTEAVFFERLPHEIYQAGEERRAGGHVERFIFPNGSEVLFRSIDDWQKHKSLNVGFIGWDEADEFDEETFLGMSSRVRQRDPTARARQQGATEITRRGMWLASNPAGHNWLYKYFVDPKTRKPNTEYFRSTSFDNPFLPPEYIEALLQYPEPWVKRYVLCQFDDFAGQIYEEWNWDDHVIEPFALPAQNLVWMGMDPGTRSPTAGLWVYVDRAGQYGPPNTLIGVAEYQETFLAANQHAKSWRELEARHRMRVGWRVADPTITTRDRGTNVQLSEQYRRLGFNFQLGPKRDQDRIPALGQLIHLRRFKVTRNCPQTFEAIKDYKWEDLTPAQRAKGIEPREKPIKRNDHLPNCAQYLASRWQVAPRLERPPIDDSFSAQAHRAIRRNLRDRALARGVQHHDLGRLVV